MYFYVIYSQWKIRPYFYYKFYYPFTFHQLINLSAYQLIDLSTYQPIYLIKEQICCENLNLYLNKLTLII